MADRRGKDVRHDKKRWERCMAKDDAIAKLKEEIEVIQTQKVTENDTKKAEGSKDKKEEGQDNKKE